MDDQANSTTRDLTAMIVSSYVANNSLRSGDLPSLIETVHEALDKVGQAQEAPALEPLVKPVSIRKSIHADYLISMEDGKQYQSLKRHLSGRGLTPVEYRAKWDLPSDYPMTAPGYSERRSALAKSLGLGRKRSEPDGVSGQELPSSAVGAAASETAEPSSPVSKPTRARKKADT